MASGPYLQVALAVKKHADETRDSAVLIFDDATGEQIDFDLRGSSADVAERLAKRQKKYAEEPARGPGRPRLGVVAREVTLLPRHWDWLAGQPGGASVALRKMVEEALRAGLTDKVQLRRLSERTYAFMSAMAGNLPGFEEASRALFANNMLKFRAAIAGWPEDVREHVLRLCAEDALPTRT
jgi:hypothetical protein